MQTATAPTDTVRPRPLRRPAAKPSQLYLRIRLADIPALPEGPAPDASTEEIFHAWAVREIAEVRTLNVLLTALRDANAPFDARVVLRGSINIGKEKAEETITDYVRQGGQHGAQLISDLEAAAA